MFIKKKMNVTYDDNLPDVHSQNKMSFPRFCFLNAEYRC